jgi:hypothetical protein
VQELAKPTTPKTPETIAEILAAIRRAQELDRGLEDWARTLPPEWRSEVAKVVTDEPVDPMSAFFWSGPVYVYADLNIANVMNEYRIARLLCQSVVLACVGALPAAATAAATAGGERLQRSYTEAVYIAQQMVNEVCSTVPFMLGFHPGRSLDGESGAEERGSPPFLAPLLPVVRFANVLFQRRNPQARTSPARRCSSQRPSRASAPSSGSGCSAASSTSAASSGSPRPAASSSRRRWRRRRRRRSRRSGSRPCRGTAS